MSTPQSTIHVCSGVRLDNRYDHSIYFPNATAQLEYFAGKVVRTFPAYSYLRKSWPLQVEATMEQAKTWNYLYFRNSSSGKIYYYFINNVEYKNDNMVELSLELDVLQTYLTEIREGLLPCFVERQHTVTDDIGEHTIDEGLDVGELVDRVPRAWDSLSSLCILVLATINPNYADTTKPIQALGGMYDGVFSGLGVWAVDYQDWQDWSDQLDALTAKNFIDGIISMWMYPKDLVILGGENEWGDDSLCKVVSGIEDSEEVFTYESGQPRLDKYQPNNNKLLCYPYRFIYATNNQGGSAVYRFERFEDPTSIQFHARGSISPDGSLKMYPANYNGVTAMYKHGGPDQGALDGGIICGGNYEQGLTLSGFPTCAWDADVYKLWLAQNQNQHQHAMGTAQMAVLGGGVTALASAFMGNVAGAVGGAGAVVAGVQQVGALLAQKADMAIQPPQARGAHSTNVNITAKMHTFTFVTKTVDKEHAEAIDDFFTMYGYKLNKVATPNLRARPGFTYVKTVGCKIAGSLCSADLVAIENIFDRGITWWVDGDTVGNYQIGNSPEVS